MTRERSRSGAGLLGRENGTHSRRVSPAQATPARTGTPGAVPGGTPAPAGAA